MSLRDLLLSAGLKPKDLRDAVKDARRTAQIVMVAAASVEGALVDVSKKKPLGKKTQATVVFLTKAARAVREVAEETLRVHKR